MEAREESGIKEKNGKKYIEWMKEKIIQQQK